MSTLLARMEAHPEVRVKDIGDGIVSCNFTRRAFQKGMWDAATTAARGLFIDTTTNEIVGRGYEKFFGIDEWQGHDLEDYLATAALPAKVTEKGNGFLGIVSYVRSGVKFFSKSGPTSYSEHFRNIFMESVTARQYGQFADHIRTRNISVLFEVIDPHCDPHIVKYDAPQLMILDAVKNTEQFQFDDIDPIVDILTGPVFTRPHTFTVTTKEALNNAIIDAQSSASEGVVIRDSNNLMVKVKSDTYKHIKSLRGTLTQALNKQPDQRAQKIIDELREAGHYLDDFLIENVTGDIVLDLPAIAEALGMTTIPEEE